MRLRDTALKDEEAVEEFFQLVRQSLTLEGNYLILLVYDRYDVPYRAKDGGGRRTPPPRCTPTCCAPSAR